MSDLKAHLQQVERLHQQDLRDGAGHVALPDALLRKYPGAAREWLWQWLFPATRKYVDDQTRETRRHHPHETVVQRAVRDAARAARLTKRASCHTLRHSFRVVYAKKPFREVGHVLRYLGRYTHRVAIANSRLVDVTDTAVSFRTKDGKITTLPPVEFLRRFLQHVLPDRFHKIRHYGLYAASATKNQLEAARQRLAPRLPEQPPPTPPPSASTSWIDTLRDLTGRDVTRCPRCDGVLANVPLPPLPRQQAPPLPRSA